MADGSLPTSKAGKQEIRTCLHGNAECMSMRLELNLASCSPHPGIPAFDLYHYCVWQGTNFVSAQRLSLAGVWYTFGETSQVLELFLT